jgi:hypothetical protein
MDGAFLVGAWWSACDAVGKCGVGTGHIAHKGGGAYVPVCAAFGESMGLLAGWTDWLSNTAAIAALSVACANFLGAIFPALLPHSASVGAVFALSIIGLNWPGVREGQIAQTLGSIVKVGMIGGVIAVALLAEPIATDEVIARAGAVSGVAAPAVGFFAVIAAYPMIYGAYTGWHAPIYFVEEDRAGNRVAFNKCRHSSRFDGVVYSIRYKPGRLGRIGLKSNISTDFGMTIYRFRRFLLAITSPHSGSE